MTPERINFDHNATTPLDAQVAAAMAACDARHYANPASAHAEGRRARARLEDAREAIGRWLGASPAPGDVPRVVLTSGGTEANNLGLLGLALARSSRGPGRAIVSAIEHSSVADAARWLGQQGWQVEWLPVTRDGLARIDALETLLAQPTSVVALMLANHDTGVVQPVAQAAALCQARGVPLFCDAVQAVGKLPVDFRALGVTALSASAHKLGGPRGAGVLVLAAGTHLVPRQFGGFQQEGLRPGTESVTLAVGLEEALSLAVGNLAERCGRMFARRAEFEAGLRAAWPAVVVHGEAATRLPHTICAALVGLDRQAMLMKLDLAGVMSSAGSACASGSSEPSPTLAAMGCSSGELESSLRFSLGTTTTAAELRVGVERIAKACNELRPEKRG